MTQSTVAKNKPELARISLHGFDASLNPFNPAAFLPGERSWSAKGVSGKYWETVRAFFEAILALTDPVSAFNFFDNIHQIYETASLW